MSPDKNQESDSGLRDKMLARVEAMRQRGIAQANPIYFWEGILFLLAIGEPLPDWAVDQVRHVALVISGLSQKCVPDGWENNTHDGPLTPPAALDKVHGLLGLTKGKTNAFARYAADNKHMEDSRTFEAHALLRSKLSKHIPSHIGTIELIAARRAIGDSANVDADPSHVERSVRRRVSKGRKLNSPPTP